MPADLHHKRHCSFAVVATAGRFSMDPLPSTYEAGSRYVARHFSTTSTLFCSAAVSLGTRKRDKIGQEFCKNTGNKAAAPFSLDCRSSRRHARVASLWSALETDRPRPAHVTRPSPHIPESCRTASSPQQQIHQEEEPPLVSAPLPCRPHPTRVAVPHLAMRCSTRRQTGRRPACSCASRP